MIARPKMSQIEWNTIEIRASKVGHVSPVSCPGLERDRSDRGAATTVANLMIRATEGHMRSSNWSATSAIAAPSALATKYRDVLSSATGLLRSAALPGPGAPGPGEGSEGSVQASPGGHHGAHYSLALVYKLYPSLVAEGADAAAVGAAAAAHLCASHRATVEGLNATSHPSAGAALATSVRESCSSTALVDDWDTSPHVDLDAVAADANVFVATVHAPPNASLLVQGLDAQLHDLPFRERNGAGVPPPRPCSIYVGTSGCYPGSKSVRKAQLQTLISRSFPTRFG